MVRTIYFFTISLFIKSSLSSDLRDMAWGFQYKEFSSLNKLTIEAHVNSHPTPPFTHSCRSGESAISLFKIYPSFLHEWPIVPHWSIRQCFSKSYGTYEVLHTTHHNKVQITPWQIHCSKSILEIQWKKTLVISKLPIFQTHMLSLWKFHNLNLPIPDTIVISDLN